MSVKTTGCKLFDNFLATVCFILDGSSCTCRFVGSYSLYAQQLVSNGELSINEPLVDANNRMLEV